MQMTALVPSQDAADILVVNDDADLISAYRCLLSSSGWRVSGASTAVCHRHIRGRAGPRLLLLCGWETVYAYTRYVPRRPATPRTVVVAYCPPHTDLAADALDHGVDLIITQPCSPPVLVRRIRAALRWSLPIAMT